ncbi:MAG: 4-hydroxy-tetrahydrodipicolinate synthase [Planctomycetes bacterium]|nr:4-hydroxy-tetrahydrodipicolinate synthase [Planctomycetota bacterium]
MIVPHLRCSLQGSYVALPTPFRNGAIDYAAFQNLVEWHVAERSDGLVIAGTTGEAATLTDNERRGLFDAAMACARGRIPVVAGVGTNCTRTTIEMAKGACASGVAALLVVTPYYNRPSQKGLALHYGAVAEAVSKPIVLYNVPSRTGVDLQPETVRELGERYTHVVAVKEALASIERMQRLVGETPCAVLCGEDGMIADCMGLGAVGVIGVVANVAPAKVRELVRLAVPDGNHVRAAMLVEELAPLVKDLFIETNPVPVKAALAMLRKCGDDVRLPLAPLADANRKKLESTLRACKLL